MIATTRVLIADDDPISRRLLEAALLRAGYAVQAARDGDEAWAMLTAPGAPRLALLDWEMPGVDGPELCRQLHARPDAPYVYVLLVTGRGGTEDIVAGLESGADDFLTKPYAMPELRSRLRAGERILQLQTRLQDKVQELEDALGQVRQLQGLLPICMHCKRIRDEGRGWQQLEKYIAERSEASFSHSLCEACLDTHYPE